MTEEFTVQFSKATEKKLLARYDNMLQKAIIDGVTLYNKHKVTEWLQKYER